ncbi:MAG TPA: DUF2203 domain-containing protein [Candidatus Limnocylindrales bacterium]|nr:DUF2203 domain-containing protein [Candidatus Limnocylindrales bacterium]
MTRFYAIDEANASIPDVERILVALRDQREDLITFRDRAIGLTPEDGEAPAEATEELRRIRLRMQGLIDQMQAGVARLVELDIQLRDIKSGLIDFPALLAGRPIWLCWRLGEPDVQHWHAVDEGFSSRRPLDELPTGGAAGSGSPA